MLEKLLSPTGVGRPSAGNTGRRWSRTHRHRTHRARAPLRYCDFGRGRRWACTLRSASRHVHSSAACSLFSDSHDCPSPSSSWDRATHPANRAYPDLWLPTRDSRQETQDQKTQDMDFIPWTSLMFNQLPRFTCDPSTTHVPLHHQHQAMGPFVCHPRSRSHIFSKPRSYPVVRPVGQFGPPCRRQEASLLFQWRIRLPQPLDQLHPLDAGQWDYMEVLDESTRPHSSAREQRRFPAG